MATKVRGIAWCDFETTGLDVDEDHILEFAFIITDFSMNPLQQFKSKPVKLTQESLARLRDNSYVAKMHRDSGLLQECRDSDVTIEEEYERVYTWFDEGGYSPGELVLGGSGVGHFDGNLMAHQMPELRKYFAYYYADIGTTRRFLEWWTDGSDVVPNIEASYKDGVKAHRAYSDVKEHVREAFAFRNWIRKLSLSDNPPF